VVYLEVVPPSDGLQHRRDDVLGEVLHGLTADADEMVMMLGVTGHVRPHVAFALDPARHPVLDLRLERAIDRRSADAGMRAPDPVVELLGAQRAPCGRQGLGDDDPLTGQAAPAR